METKNMNMRPAPKKDNSNGLLGGALGAAIGTAFGATFGVGGAYAYNKLTEDDSSDLNTDNIDAQEFMNDQDVAIADHPTPPTHHVHHVHQTHDVYVVNANEPDSIIGTGGGGNNGNVHPINNTDPEVRVLSYERVTMDDGSQMDVATVSIDGQEAAIVDVDLDGWADGMIADANLDGNISEDEITSFQGTDVRIEMGPLAQAANYQGDDDFAGGDVVVTSDDEILTDDDMDTYQDDNEDMILVSNDETPDDVMPDYVNNGDVSDMTGDTYLASNDEPIDDGGDMMLV